jgi:hypothetical protein
MIRPNLADAVARYDRAGTPPGGSGGRTGRLWFSKINSRLIDCTAYERFGVAVVTSQQLSQSASACHDRLRTWIQTLFAVSESLYWAVGSTFRGDPERGRQLLVGKAEIQFPFARRLARPKFTNEQRDDSSQMSRPVRPELHSAGTLGSYANTPLSPT